MKLTIKQKLIAAMIMIAITILLGGTSSLAVSKAKVIVETANLREKASSEAKIVELISRGEEVEIISTSGNWYQISYKGITGYLRNDLVEVEETKENDKENSTSTNVTTNSTHSETTNTTNSTTNEAGTNTSEGQATNQTDGNQNTETPGNTQTTDSSENTPKQEQPVLTGTYKVVAETNMKITPLITSLTIGTLPKDKEVEVIKVMNQWAWVDNNGSQAWVYYGHLEKIENQEGESSKQEENKTDKPTEDQKPEENKKQETKTMYVNSQTVNIRKKADKTAELLTQLSLNTAVEVISEENGWSQIKVNGQTGYISSSLLSTTKQQTSRGTDEARQPIQGEEEKKQETPPSSNASSSQSNTNANASNSTSASGSAVVAYANQFIGYPYVYGGTSPSGFDCSGFTSYVYRHFGVSLNRTAAGQASNGTSVSKSNLQPGDLLLFCSPINHVGIYIGGGRMVHAANRTRGVTTDTINSGYYLTNYVGARRIFN